MLSSLSMLHADSEPDDALECSLLGVSTSDGVICEDNAAIPWLLLLAPTEKIDFVIKFLINFRKLHLTYPERGYLKESVGLQGLLQVQLWALETWYKY